MHVEMKHIWIRSEIKSFEKRVALTPYHAGILVKNGYKISVEESAQRYFSINEYAKVGCEIVAEQTWPDAPLNAYILGIKELASESFPLIHKHIYFAHVYKKQKNASEILERFKIGGGTLLDMEYLTDFNGDQLVTRGAGFWAGVCAAAVVLDIWIQKQASKIRPFVINECFDSLQCLLTYLQDKLVNCSLPEILIIGANGMSGQGVQFILDKLNLKYDKWTRENTKSGPIRGVLNFNVLFNCVMVDKDTGLFITPEILTYNKKLSIIGDVSCDPSSPYNPIPLYMKPTTFSNPTVAVDYGDYALDIMAIDHVTTLLPKETSYALSEEIFPYLCQLLLIGDDLRYSPWEKSINEFNRHIKLL